MHCGPSLKIEMGCHGNKFIVPSPSVDFTSNNQILKYQCPHYKNMWVYKNPTRGDDFTFWPMDYNEHIGYLSLNILFDSHNPLSRLFYDNDVKTTTCT